MARIALVLILGSLAAALLLTRPVAAPTEPRPATVQIQPRPSQPPQDLQAATPPQAPATPAPGLRAGQIRLPDGSFLPNLNGVRQAITWTRKEVTPVVDRVVDPQSGIEWYVHADGLYSTTVMVEKQTPQGVTQQAVLSYARPERRPLGRRPGLR